MTAGRTWVLLAALYLAQGLPYGFFTQALPVLMRDAGYSLTAISATSLLFLPWALKFLWAPWVDHRGSRRDWLLPLQVAGVLLALLLAGLPLSGSLPVLFAALLLFNLIAATQDIATDGLAVRLLGPAERGLANGIQVGGYRLGMVLGGGLLLWLYARMGWSGMLLTMAALLALTVLPVLGLQEPTSAPSTAPPARLWTQWWSRLRQPGMATFIGLIGAYKFGDTMASAHIGPLMVDLGVRKEEIAVIKGVVGALAGLAGAAAGGWMAYRVGRRRTLLACGLLQTASLLPYLLVALGGPVLPLLWAGSVVEHLFGGMATVALFTLMMDAADRDHAGTDYTLLACIIVVVMGLAAFTGGLVGDLFGFPALLALAILLSGAGCLLLVGVLDRGSALGRLNPVWQPHQGAVR